MKTRTRTAESARAASVAVVLMVAIALSGCGGTAPSSAIPVHSQTTYTARPGDTVYHIASRFGVSVGRLMAANAMSDPRELRVGQTLVIPGSYRAPSVGAAYASNAYPYRGLRSSRQFAWPVKEGTVSSGFGIRHGAMHDGVDIAAPVGTAVHAADSGTVIFAGRLHGYGNTVIIQHDPHYATVYGHDEINYVREGQHVTRGQTIGKIGETGRVTGANLHFEVRQDNVARNPLAYLPDPPATAGITFAAGGGS